MGITKEIDNEIKKDNKIINESNKKDKKEGSSDIISERCSVPSTIPHGYPDLRRLRSEATRNLLNSKKRIIHFKGYCARIDYTRGHVKEMRKDFIQHLKDLKPDLVCWDGDE